MSRKQQQQQQTLMPKQRSLVYLTYRDALGRFAPDRRMGDTVIEHSSAADLKVKCDALVSDAISSRAYASSVYLWNQARNERTVLSRIGDGWFSTPPWPEYEYQNGFSANPDAPLLLFIAPRWLKLETREGVERACMLACGDHS